MKQRVRDIQSQERHIHRAKGHLALERYHRCHSVAFQDRYGIFLQLQNPSFKVQVQRRRQSFTRVTWSGVWEPEATYLLTRSQSAAEKAEPLRLSSTGTGVSISQLSRLAVSTQPHCWIVFLICDFLQLLPKLSCRDTCSQSQLSLRPHRNRRR